VRTPGELARLFQQKTWEKDVVLWIGSEGKLRELLGAAPHTALDLLDLFDPDRLPMDADETRTDLQRNLRAWLRGHAPGSSSRLILLVRSVGLLARYRVPLNDFYDWFCHDFAMVVLLLPDLAATGIGAPEVICNPARLLQYFSTPDVVKQVYGEGV
jgi:hypothetical protein